MTDQGRQISTEQLAARYERLFAQLNDQLNCGPKRTDDPIARMATISALLYAKMPHFFWAGFYRLVDGQLLVGPYQGPLACSLLLPPDGVCWQGITGGKSIIVPDVHAFAGHVACDPRSQSEIVVPVRNEAGKICAVLDVDSDKSDSFGAQDQLGLEKIVSLVFSGLKNTA